jgi:hypothetical protein
MIRAAFFCYYDILSKGSMTTGTVLARRAGGTARRAGRAAKPGRGEHREQPFEVPALAHGARGLLIAHDKHFDLFVAFPAVEFVEGHTGSRLA